MNKRIVTLLTLLISPHLLAAQNATTNPTPTNQPVPATASNTTTSASQPISNTVQQPVAQLKVEPKFNNGWLATVYASPKDDAMTVPKNSIGSYVLVGDSPYLMRDIVKDDSVNWFKEDASVLLHGYFKAKEAGHFTFINQLGLVKNPLNRYSKDHPNGIVCAVRLDVEGNDIISDTLILDVDNYVDGATIVNGLELQEGYYNTKLWVSCIKSGNATASTSDVSFSLRVKEPSSMTANHLTSKNVFLKVK